MGRGNSGKKMAVLGVFVLFALALGSYLVFRSEPASAQPSVAATPGEVALTPEKKLVEKVEAKLPQKLEALGVTNSRQVDIHWTAYYVTPVKYADPSKGRDITFIALDGTKKKVHLTNAAFKQAELEAVAVGVDKKGNNRFAYRVSEGVWKELPEGSAGMGNKVNTLVPMIHVASDQRKYPYGSMIFLPVAVGIKMGGGLPMDGYFWVSDTGGAIKGDHFDLFVGDNEVYQDFIRRDIKPTYETTIYPLPAAPKDMNPRKAEGLAKILKTQELLREADQSDKEKVIEALLLFQRANPHVPVAEYGDPNGATTLWFLTQAAIKASGGK